MGRRRRTRRDRYRATPRFTMDVDTLAAAHHEMVEQLRSAGFVVDVVADGVHPPHLLRCRRGPAAVDVLIPVIEYQHRALDRAVDHVITPEDVIIHKLIAWRPRDRDDIRSMLEAGVALDDAYLDEWISAWDLADRWATFDALR